jgi:hypothetical protein
MLDSKAIRQIVNDYIKKHEVTLRTATGDKLELAAGMVEIVMGHYMTYYRDDFVKMQIHKAESVFAVSILDAAGNHVLTRGRQDGIFSYRPKDDKWLIEHKSMGTVSEDVLKKRLPIDKQLLFYIMAEEAETDYCISGVLYNVVRRPMLKFNDDVVAYLQRLDKDVDERPDFYFIRYPVVYTQKDKEEFICSTREKLAEVREFLDGKLAVYRNEDACESANNGAPYVCQYAEACANRNLVGYRQQASLFPELWD